MLCDTIKPRYCWGFFSFALNRSQARWQTGFGASLPPLQQEFLLPSRWRMEASSVTRGCALIGYIDYGPYVEE